MTKKFETALVQAGRRPTREHGYVNPKLVRGSTVLHTSVAAKAALGKRAFGAGRHIRPVRQ